jgi:hypothetical protein
VAVESRNRRALLIGINSYPNLDARFQLRGCANDVALMSRILKDHFGFPETEITELVEDQATRDRILLAMDDLVERTDAGDIVVIHYSGHGSRMTDREGDEPDGRDETIVPYDSARAPKQNRDITDDEIYVRLGRLTEKTTNVTLIFDCCHSGTIARDAFGGAERWLPADDRPVEELPPSPVTPEAVRGGTRDLGPSGWLPVTKRYVLIAGCRDEESSCEHRVREANEDVTHGAMTFFLGRELVQAPPGATYRDVFERAGALVSATYPRQHPQMEGTGDRELFGVRDIEPVRFVGVASRSASQVTLAAGAAHGVMVGSAWTVHPQGSKRAEEESRIGSVRIARVGGVASTALVLDERAPNAITAGSRAVETSHAFGDLRLRVQVHAPGDPSGAGSGLEAAIERSPLLLRADVGAPADLRAYLVPPRDEVGAEDPVPQLGAVREATWAVVGGDGRLVMPPRPVSEPDAIAAIRENLETIARYRHALGLTNPATDGVLNGKVDLVLKRRAPDGGWTPAEPESAGGQVVFEEGERIAVEVVNRHGAPIFVTVLDFGLSGAIGAVHPPSGPGELVAAGRRLVAGEREGQELVLGFPPVFPFGREPGESEPAGGVETFKVFATTHPADFSPLLQGGVRDLAQPLGATSPLGRLLSMALLGPTTRDIARPMPVQTRADEEWTTVERAFFLRRRRP